MPDMLYRKVGKRYSPVGEEFLGWPAEGLWIVKKNSYSLVLDLKKVCSLEGLSPIGDLAQHLQLIGNKIQEGRERYDSSHNIALAIIEAIATE